MLLHNKPQSRPTMLRKNLANLREAPNSLTRKICSALNVSFAHCCRDSSDVSSGRPESLRARRMGNYYRPVVNNCGVVALHCHALKRLCRTRLVDLWSLGPGGVGPILLTRFKNVDKVSCYQSKFTPQLITPKQCEHEIGAKRLGSYLAILGVQTDMWQTEQRYD